MIFTVGDLIKELEKYDENLGVYTLGFEGDSPIFEVKEEEGVVLIVEYN